jgi:chemotaxis protein methyltransferase CheR
METRISLDMTPEEEEAYIKKIKEWIFNNLHFDSSNYNDSYLRRRIQSRMFFNQLKSLKDYKDILEIRVREQEELLKNLTVNVTRFFRNIPVWTEFSKSILPQIINSKTGVKRIKIWSAGCSSGEEPYSIAILILEHLKDSIKDYDIKIWATDIDNSALNSAIVGEYSEMSLAEVRADLKDKYFIKEKDIFVIKNEVKHLVHFQHHDLFHDPFLENLDLIICRNVVIYFRKESKESLYLKFFESLSPESYFIMGRTETLTGPAREKFKVINSDEKIYQKPKF